MSRLKDVPELARDGSNLNAVISAVREVIQTFRGYRGDPLDAALTRRTATAAGILNPDGSAAIGSGSVGPAGPAGPAGPSGDTYTPDLTPPPTAEGLSVTAGIGHLYISCSQPVYTQGHGHDLTVVYGAKWPNGAAPTFSNAVELMRFQGIFTAYASDPNTRWCIWIKWLSVDDVLSVSPAGGTNGVQATTGKIGNADLGPLIIEAENLASGAVTADKVAAAALDATKFASSIEPITMLTGTLPTVKSTSTIFRTDDGKLYRWNGSAYVATLASTDIAGTIADAQIAGMAAAKVTGTLTNAQIAAIDAAKITGTLTSAQITDLDSAKLTGQITSTQITDSAITTAKINAGAIVTAKIAAGAVTASEIASGSITTAKIAAGAVTAAEIAAGSIVAGKIAVGAIVATDISAGAITSAQIAAGTIEASNIAAGTITGDRLQANTVTADRLVANSITAGQIQAGAIGATQIAANAITTNKLLVTGMGDALNPDPNTQDISAWAGGTISIVADTAAPARTALNISSTGSTTLGTEFPLDELKNYNLRVTARQVSGASSCYLGVAFLNAAGSAVVGTGWPGTGTYNYFGLVNAQPPGTFTEYRISFGPNETAKIPDGARTAQIVILGNYTGAGVQRFTNIRCVEKAGADLIVDGSIIATKLAANSIAVGSAAIQNGAIINAMIENATIDDAKIANLSASKITAGSLGVGSYVRSTSYTPGSTGFSINADGTAEFNNVTVRGTVYATAGEFRGVDVKNAAGTVILSSGSTIQNQIAPYQSGATVGATWGSNLAGQPADTEILNNSLDGALRIPSPGGGGFNGGSSGMVGYLKITLPQDWSNTMVKFTVDIYEYLTGYSCTLEIGGYTYAGAYTWHNVTARVVGSSNVEYPVRFGNEASKCCVWIGTSHTDVWEYPVVRVRDFMAGYSNYAISQWATGWNVSLDAASISVGTGNRQYSAEVLDTLPGANWSKVSGSGKPADNATVGATIGTNLSGQITAGNASTFIANAAIQDAQIGTLNASKIVAGTITTDKLVANATTAAGIFNATSSANFVTASNATTGDVTIGSLTSTGARTKLLGSLRTYLSTTNSAEGIVLYAYVWSTGATTNLNSNFSAYFRLMQSQTTSRAGTYSFPVALSLTPSNGQSVTYYYKVLAFWYDGSAYGVLTDAVLQTWGEFIVEENKV